MILFLTNTGLEIEKLNLLSQKQDVLREIEIIKKGLEVYQTKIQSQQHLLSLTDSMEKERAKLLEAITFEKQIEAAKFEYNSSRSKMVALLKQRFKEYIEIVEKINGTKANIGSEVTLQSSSTLSYLTDSLSINE